MYIVNKMRLTADGVAGGYITVGGYHHRRQIFAVDEIVPPCVGKNPPCVIREKYNI